MWGVKMNTGNGNIFAKKKTLAARMEHLQQCRIRPMLALLRFGEQVGDLFYEESLYQRCHGAGISFCSFSLPLDCGQEQITTMFRLVRENRQIHACFILPPAAKETLLPPLEEIDSAAPDALVERTVKAAEQAGFACKKIYLIPRTRQCM